MNVLLILLYCAFGAAVFYGIYLLFKSLTSGRSHIHGGA